MNTIIRFSIFISLLFIIQGCKISEAVISDSYEELWQKVDSLDKLNLPQSTLNIVNIIHSQSGKEQKTEDYIRSLIMRFEMSQKISNNALESFISETEQEVEHLWIPARQMVHSILGDLYLLYYQQNSWRLQQEVFSETDNVNLADMSAIEIMEKSMHHYISSLEGKEILASESSYNYDILLKEGKEKLKFRPSLYDLLVNRMIDKVFGEYLFELHPVGLYEFSDDFLFASREEFISNTVDDKFLDEPLAIALKNLQQWLLFRQNAGNLDVLYDIDLLRLKLMYKKYPYDDGIYLYEDALQKLALESSNSEVFSSVLYEHALLLYQSQYTSSLNKNRNILGEALQLCIQAVDSWPESEGALLARNLQKQILQSSFYLYAESVIPLDQPVAYTVEYKNLDSLFIALYSLEHADLTLSATIDRFQFSLEELRKRKAVYSEHVALPDFRDFSVHMAELALPPVKKSGFYCLLVSSEPLDKGNNEETPFLTVTFQVSNLAFQEYKQDKGLLLSVVDRNTGQPLSEANVKAFIYSKLNESPSKELELTTNQEGRIMIEPLIGNDRLLSILIQKKNDVLFSSPSYYYFPQKEMFSTLNRISIFTDRNIYRPGQFIHFKGVWLSNTNDSIYPMVNEQLKVYFRDANGGEIASQSFVTNEYGSFSGRFLIPKGRLTGNFSIGTAFGQKMISVEEYKRPSFDLVFEPYREVSVIGDTISIKGSALTFTGMPLKNVSLQWKVVRQRGFRYYMPSAQGTVIASGLANTDNKGGFSIDYVATGEKSYNQISPYHYQLIVNVTNESGETQTASQTITLGKNAYNFSLNVKPEYFLDKLKDFSALVDVRNLSGEALSSDVIYVIEKLKNKGEILPYRMWDEPDTLLHEYSKLFSSSLYSELDAEVELIIQRKRINISGKQEIKISLPENISPGSYKISLMLPQNSGDSLVATDLFRLIDPLEKTYKHDEALSLINLSDSAIKSGDQINFLVGSGFNAAVIKILVSDANNVLLDKQLVINKSWKKISLRVNDNVEGPVRVQAVLLFQNRFYSKELELEFVKPEDQLFVDFIKADEDLVPGKEYSWMLRLSDGNQKPVETELLALMYDASLDIYRSNNLFFNIPKYYKTVERWRWNSGSLAYGNGRRFDYTQRIIPALYPQFIWNKLSGLYNGSGMRLKSSSYADVVPMMSKESLNIRSEIADDLLPITSQAQEMEESFDSDLKEYGIQIRRDLKETAFFLPHIVSNKEGLATLNFKMPESLTRWNFMALAHRKDGVYVTSERTVTSVLDLMVHPFLPRIVTEGDELLIKADILNNSITELEGFAFMEIKDVISGEIIRPQEQSKQLWKAAAGEITTLSWDLIVPHGLKALEFTFCASSDMMSDCESHILPVRPERVAHTETASFMYSSPGQYQIDIPLIRDAKGKEIENFSFSYKQNAIWEILDVLPWLMERPYESSDQIFNRFFAASIARELLLKHPSLGAIFKTWAYQYENNEQVLLSALEDKLELKSILLEATPWQQFAHSDTERKRYFAALIKEGYLEQEINESLKLLKDQQLNNGAWPWYKGMHASEYTTINIMSGLAYLIKQNINFSDEINEMADKANKWLLDILKERRKAFENSNEFKNPFRVIGPLYALSFFHDLRDNPDIGFWNEYLSDKLPRNSIPEMAHTALILNRAGYSAKAQQLLKSLEERLIKGENKTLYFALPKGPYWYQAPIEMHVVALEAFNELQADDSIIEGMRNWLIQQKRSQSWLTTRATVSAVYALMSSPVHYFDNKEADLLKIGDKEFLSAVGEGYSFQSFNQASIKPEMAVVNINKKGNYPSFAAWHVSYYEKAEDIKAGGFLNVQNNLYRRNMVDNKELWEKVDGNAELKPGDHLMFQLIIDSPQALDFVHINAPRAANLEPLDLLSGYRHKDGLGYYMSISDNATSLFIDHLPEGRYSVSWEVVVSFYGSASYAPATVSCFYAPEFSGNDKGGRINVK